MKQPDNGVNALETETLSGTKSVRTAIGAEQNVLMETEYYFTGSKRGDLTKY